MPVFAGDRVKETTTTEGAGNIALAGAVSGFRAFSALFATNVDWFYYTIIHRTATEWEAGIGRLTGASTLERVSVISSSASNARVAFTAGTKDIFLSPGATGVSHPGLLYFGSGAEGDVTLSSGSVLFEGNPCYRNLTLSGTVAFTMYGMPLLVSGVLDLTAAPANAITPGGVATSAAGGNASGSTAGSGGTGQIGYMIGATPTAGGGGAGGTATGTNGSDAAQSYHAFGGPRSVGGAGGSGSGGAGGTGGAAAQANRANKGPLMPFLQIASGTQGFLGGRGGNGGGGGGGDGVAGGGGGGGGGSTSVQLIFARIVRVGGSTAAGCVRVNGGNGGNGAAATAGNRGGGGGGAGASGGLIYVICEAIEGTSPDNVLQANGGNGGTGGVGFGTGTAGAGGQGGHSGQICVVQLAKGKSVFAGNQQVAGATGSGTAGGAGALCQARLEP